MGTDALYRRLSSVLHANGECRFQGDGCSMLITRNDRAYTLISVLVTQDGQSGSLTLELDDGALVIHHPRNLELVERAINSFCPRE